MDEFTVNFSDPRAQADLFSQLRKLRGVYRITVVQSRPRRTDAQNRYLWACINRLFGDFLREQDPSYTDDFAHALLKEKFLRVPVIDKHGELIGMRARSTTELDVEEFSNYIEACVAYLADEFHVVCPEPSLAGV